MALKQTLPLQTQKDGVRSRTLKGDDGTPLLRYSLSPLTLPDLPCRSGRRIRHYHEAVENQWRAYWETTGLAGAAAAYGACREEGRPFIPLSCSLTTSVSYFGGGLLCVRQDALEDAGDGRPNAALHTVTWDVRAGAPLPLSAFFPHDRRWKRTVLDAVRAEAARMEKSGEYLLDTPAEEAVLHAFSPEHYLLTPTGLAVFFPHCSVAAHAEGILVLPLPFPLFGPCNHRKNNV